MPQSLSNILLHLIFSTKDRQPWLKPGVRTATHAFLAGTVRQYGCEAYRVGGVEDHVHLAIRFSRTVSYMTNAISGINCLPNKSEKEPQSK